MDGYDSHVVVSRILCCIVWQTAQNRSLDLLVGPDNLLRSPDERHGEMRNLMSAIFVGIV